MQIKATNTGGCTNVEVIDPSDHAVTHQLIVEDGQQVVITVTSATSPEDLQVGEVESAVGEPDAADTGEQADTGEPAKDAADAAEGGEQADEDAVPGSSTPEDGE